MNSMRMQNRKAVAAEELLQDSKFGPIKTVHPKTVRNEQEISQFYINPYSSANNQTARRKLGATTNRAAPTTTAKKPEAVYKKESSKMQAKPRVTGRQTAGRDQSKVPMMQQRQYSDKQMVSCSGDFQRDVQRKRDEEVLIDEEPSCDESDEFFEIIRNTVQKVVNKCVTQAFQQHFCELNTKIDRFSKELKHVGVQLKKLETDTTNKIVHYGEENTRHFRYLCMKADYDKMYYQHSALLATKPLEKIAKEIPKCFSQEKLKKSKVAEEPCSNCAARKHKKSHKKEREHDASAKVPPKTERAVNDNASISRKSSDERMREVLSHIQRFCNQMQLNEGQDERDEDMLVQTPSFGSINLDNKPPHYDEEDDDYPLSSDGMSTGSDVSEERARRHVEKNKRDGRTARGSSSNVDGSSTARPSRARISPTISKAAGDA